MGLSGLPEETQGEKAGLKGYKKEIPENRVLQWTNKTHSATAILGV